MQSQQKIEKNALIYGNKAANLIELTEVCKHIESKYISVQVPKLSAISNKDIQDFLSRHLKTWRSDWEAFVKIQSTHKTLLPESISLLQKLQSSITEVFNRYSFNIDKSMLDGDLLMVRSTGEEDGLAVSNPGGNQSIAAVKPSITAVSQAIGKVVASYFSEKSLTQRLLSGDDISKQPFLPVLIQKMVNEQSDDIIVSGVIYAKDRLTHIDAAFGHGELIVSSRGYFDSYDVTEEGIVHPEIYEKSIRLVGSTTVQNPKSLQEHPSLTPLIARAIAEVAQTLLDIYKIELDMEFVFSPKNKILYLVQLRPIPAPKNLVEPKTILPEYWVAIKQDKSIEKIAISSIVSGGDVLQSIESQHRIIFENTIESALDNYLNRAIQSKVFAVIIRHHAASMSHAAAFFSALNIPVVQTVEVNKIQQWFKESNSVIMLDPQHSHIIRILDGHKLLKENIVAHGLFSSSSHHHKTLLPKQSLENKSIDKTLEKYRVYTTERAGKNYQNLLKLFDLLEAVKINDSNTLAFQALLDIAFTFKMLATSRHAKIPGNPHQSICANAMLSIAEIDHALTKHSSISDEKAKIPSQQYFLHLVSKLKALVINPGVPFLYSDSILQIAMQNKKRGLTSVVKSKIALEELDYFAEFKQLEKFALCDNVKKVWLIFAEACIEKQSMRQQLAKTILLSNEYGLTSDLINLLFPAHFGITCTEISDKLYKMITQTHDELEKYHFKKYQLIIQQFEKMIPKWSDPERFDALYKQFDTALAPLINQISIHDKMSDLTKKVILEQVRQLAEVIDQTIKTLKGSPHYAHHKDLLLRRFIILLKPYHVLMLKWIREIPDSAYTIWSIDNRGTGTYGKENICAAISYIFGKLCKSRDSKQLNASHYLSVASAKIGSTASFKRQFIDRQNYFTLEDLFSLFHQNILSATIILNKNTFISEKHLPKLLQPLLKEISKCAELLGMRYQHPNLFLEYNIPLRNHSAKIFVEYDTSTQVTILTVYFFGHNERGWMRHLKLCATLDGILLGANIISQPRYDVDQRSLQFKWSFKAEKILYLSKKMNSIIDSYVELTFKEDGFHYSLGSALINRYGLKDQFRDFLSSSIAYTRDLYEFFEPWNLMKYLIESRNPDVLDVIKKHIDATPKLLDAKDNQNETLISHAVYEEDVSIVEYLISRKANLEVASQYSNENHNGMTPLCWAVNRKNAAITKLLLEAKANTMVPKVKHQPLQYAIIHQALDIVKLFIETRPELLEQKFDNNQTPLIVAATEGHDEIVHYLIQQKANLNATIYYPNTEDHEKTALYLALEKKHEVVVKALMTAGANTSLAKSLMKFQPVHLAAQQGNLAIVTLLIESHPEMLESKDSFHQTPLLWAAAKGHTNVVQYLMEKKADVNAASHRPKSTDHKKTVLDWALKGNHFECATLLIDGSDLLEKRNGLGQTPLLRAVSTGNLKAVDYLVDKKADVNMALHNPESKDHGKIPLHIALLSGFPVIANALNRAGSNISLMTDEMFHAAKIGSMTIIRFLIEHHPKLLDKEDKFGQTLLLIATSHGHKEMVEYLINKKANLNVVAFCPGHINHKKTALQLAAEKNHTEIFNMLKNVCVRDISKLTSRIASEIQLIDYIEEKQSAFFQNFTMYGFTNSEKIAAAVALKKVALHGGDPSILNKHENVLNEPELREIYRVLKR